jgi:tetratricopeptide (TPR) repeat protein
MSWLASLDQELDNLRAVLRWAVDQGQAGDPAAVELGLGAAGALGLYWFLRGRLMEGRGWLQALLGLDSMRSAAWALACVIDSLLAANLAQDSGSSLEEALAFYREQGDQVGIGLCLWVDSTRSAGHADERTALCAQEACALFEAAGEAWLAAWAREFWAHALLESEPAQARRLLEEALTVRRQVGEPFGLGATLGALAMVTWKLGDVTRAHELATEALRLDRQVGAPTNVVVVQTLLGLLLMAMGDYAAARSAYMAALRELDALGLRHLCRDVLLGLAALAAARGQPVRAVRLAGAAERTSGPLGYDTFLRQVKQGWLERARAALGEDDAAAAWAAGQGLPLEHALAEAVGDLATEEMAAPAVPS